jgi:hypothetical protein
MGIIMEKLIKYVRKNGSVILDTYNEAVKLVMEASQEGYRFGYKEQNGKYKVVIL